LFVPYWKLISPCAFAGLQEATLQSFQCFKKGKVDYDSCLRFMHEKFEPSEDLLKMQQYVRGYALQRDNFGAVRDVLHVRDMPLYVSRSYDKVCGIKVPVAKKGAPKSSIPSSGLSVVQKCVGYLMDLLKDAVEPGSRMTIFGFSGKIVVFPMRISSGK
jgi:hypothetical protein